MILGRRLRAALGLAASDATAWPLGMLGFLARGGVVVLALPLLTLPSPVGLGTLLGPAVISTGRLEGPLAWLVLVSGAVLVVVVGMAIVTAAFVQAAVAARRAESPADRAAPSELIARPRSLWRLTSVELVAIAPIVAVLTITATQIVDQVREELLLPGDLAVPLLARVASRIIVPLGAVLVALVLAEVIDGVLSRRVLWPSPAGRRTRRRVADVAEIGATAVVGWLVTLAVLVPGLVILDQLWQATRVAWGQLPSGSPAAAPGPSTPGPDVALATIALLVLVAAWCGLLVLCGIASLVRAELWTRRVVWPGSGRASDTSGDGA